MATLRIGIVGSRFAAHLHLLAYRRVYGLDVRLAGVTSPTAERREAFARASGATSYPSVAAMLPHVDVVDVCSPPATHEPVALEAMTPGERRIVHELLKDDPAKYPAIERLYRIAAAWGHDKANHNLALMLIRGHSDADDVISLPVALAQDLIKRGIPQGYYDMGALLTKGYGVAESNASALQYLRHAADLGNPDAQYYVGDQLFSLGIDYPVPLNIGLQMKKCAAEQGHSEAAISGLFPMEDDKINLRFTGQRRTGR